MATFPHRRGYDRAPSSQLSIQDLRGTRDLLLDPIELFIKVGPIRIAQVWRKARAQVCHSETDHV